MSDYPIALIQWIIFLISVFARMRES